MKLLLRKDIPKLGFVGDVVEVSAGYARNYCRALLSLYTDRKRRSADVKAIALNRIADIDRKVTQLGEMRSVLATLADKCHGDERPDCPILDDFAAAQE